MLKITACIALSDLVILIVILFICFLDYDPFCAVTPTRTAVVCLYHAAVATQQYVVSYILQQLCS